VAAALWLALGPLSAHAALGGPDAFGYVWDDAYPYAWVDARTGGTPLGGAGNANTNWPGISLGMTMNFYGIAYNAVNICSNGWVSFTDGLNTTSGPVAIPNAAAPNAFVAGLMTYFDPNGSAGGYIYYNRLFVGSNQALVVEWYNVPTGTGFGAPRFTWEMLLLDNANIIFQYQGSTSGLTKTIGIENETGTIGLPYPGTPGGSRAIIFSPGYSTLTPTPVPPTATETATYDTYTPTPTATITRTYTITRTPTISLSATRTATKTVTPSPTIPAAGEVAAVPNPFPAGHGAFAVFQNIPSGSRVAIYTFSGTQVRRWDRLTSPNPVWDGRNDAKQDVAPGAYFYVVTLPGGRQVMGTLYVERK